MSNEIKWVEHRARQLREEAETHYGRELGIWFERIVIEALLDAIDNGRNEALEVAREGAL